MIYPALFFLFTFFGFFAGSFLKVVIDRTLRGESFWKGRSYCESCRHGLGAGDLIPLFSFLVLKGKCRYCGVKIPSGLLVTELMTGLLFGLTFLYWAYNGPATDWVVYYAGLAWLLVLVSVLLAIFFTDLQSYVIPDLYLYAILLIYLVGFGIHLFTGEVILGSFYAEFISHLAGGVLMLFLFAVLHFGTRGKAMGEGDIYLAGLLGLFLGLAQSIVMWFISFLTGAVIGVILILVGRKRVEHSIPFGPFLIWGALLAHLVGDKIVKYYLALL